MRNLPPLHGTRPGVLIRDLVIFHIKLALDGLKDIVLIWLSVGAVILDLLVGGSRRGRFFYKVMHLGERFDLWLNLYGASQRAAENPDGLFGESRAGDDTLLGELEELVRKEDRGEPVRRPAGPGRPGPLPGRR